MEKHLPHISINLDKIKLDVKGKNAYKYLREINTLLEKLQTDTDEEFVTLNMKLEQELSDELVFNKKIASIIQNCYQIYPSYQSARTSIEHKQIIQLENQTMKNGLETQQIKQALQKLFFRLPTDKIKHAIIHVKSIIDKSMTDQIVDGIATQLPKAEITPVITQNAGLSTHTIIECVFFGDFPETNE